MFHGKNELANARGAFVFRAWMDLVEAFAREVCHDSIAPPLLPTVERLTLPNSLGTEIPVLKVELTRHLFVHRRGRGRSSGC